MGALPLLIVKLRGLSPPNCTVCAPPPYAYPRTRLYALLINLEQVYSVIAIAVALI